MMTMLLPIPSPRKEFKFFFIPYQIKSGYCNHSGEIKLRQTDNISAVHDEIYNAFKIQRGSYIVTKVQDNEFQRWFSAN